jgi:hypothetical protein
MKKRSLKSLSLNKKSISHLDRQKNKGGFITYIVNAHVSRLACPSPMDAASRLLGCDL